ncbi:hypothetical protein ACFSKL_05930 [Belliella marina]|uniref:SPOR domain-containing protein n=1 Tax=Belliella marina TaxID=1644146 RepID=A0ABW4VJP7_9BACT
MMKSFLGGIVLVFLLGSCNLIKKVGGDTDKFDSYQEDLSPTRISFPSMEDQSVTATPSETFNGSLAVDEDLEYALRKFADKNRSERYYSGFTVLVYSGVDRDAAFGTRNELYSRFPNIKTEMEYQQPRYLVKVGKFTNRIEAQAYYNKLKHSFPMTRIIQERFKRNGYVDSEQN